MGNHNYLRALDRHKADILAVIFFAGLCIYYKYYISLMQVPTWDGAVYLENARNWLNGTPLSEGYRPPLLSLLIAGIWGFTGENWLLVRSLQAAFTIGSGILLYLLLRKYKNKYFALGVAGMTMMNTYVFFYSTQIYTEGLALFFLVATLFLLKSETPMHWMLAGVAMGLTFASRYPIIIQAAVLLLAECLVRKNWRIFTKALEGAIPVISMAILAVFIKMGTFQTALEKDMQFTSSLSPFYLLNSVDIWGLVVLLVPVAFFFKKTYLDKFNYSFIAWFISSLVFWSANASNYNPRFTIQFAPAVYYMAMIAIENMAKASFTAGSLMASVRARLDGFRAKLGSLRDGYNSSVLNRKKVHFTIVLLFWSVLIVASPLYLNSFINTFGFAIPSDSVDSVPPMTGYILYSNSTADNSAFSSRSCRYNFPGQRTIILRMDDVQGRAWSNIVPNITDTILDRNMSVTLAVIPARIDESAGKASSIRNYLLIRRNDTRVEIAMHGLNHTEYEFSKLTEAEAYASAKAGLEKMVASLGVYPVTFIPPNNVYNGDTTKALSRLGFAVFSAKQDEYKFDGNMLSVGYTAATKYSNVPELVPVGSVLNACRRSLDTKNICVVMMHPQDYVNSDKVTLNQTRYVEFVRLLDGLQKLNATSSTFSQLVACK